METMIQNINVEQNFTSSGPGYNLLGLNAATNNGSSLVLGMSIGLEADKKPD